MDLSKPKVLVIGAGMAGLSAASQLSDSGLFDITVLEAMDRPGGRIHSTWEMGNTVLELGANWIHGTEGNPVYDLAAKHNLLGEEDSSSSESSSESTSESASEDSTSAEWFQSVDEDLFFCEDGTLVPKGITKDATCLYSSILEDIQQQVNDSGDNSKFDKERMGELLDRVIQQKMSTLNLEPSTARFYRLMFGWCMRQECVDNGCQSMKDVPVVSFHDYKALLGNYYCTLGDQGYQGVLDVLLKKIPEGRVKYNAAVTKVDWKVPSGCKDEASAKEQVGPLSKRTKPVNIMCKNGDEFSADHVIITASVGYLKRNHRHLFFPALPDDKQRTLSMFGFGTINKIYLRYKKPFWRKMFKKAGDLDGIQVLWDEDFSNADSNQCEMVTSEGEIEKYFMKKVTGFDTVENHPNMLVGWISGAEAEYLETLDDEKIGKACTEVLRKFLTNPRIPEPAEVLCTRWHSNPYVCGSYGAYLAPEASGNEYDIMMEPVYGKNGAETKEEQSPLLLFAGEAYHKGFQSTTHGAMATGYNQADRLIKMYQNLSKN